MSLKWVFHLTNYPLPPLLWPCRTIHFSQISRTHHYLKVFNLLFLSLELCSPRYLTDSFPYFLLTLFKWRNYHKISLKTVLKMHLPYIYPNSCSLPGFLFLSFKIHAILSIFLVHLFTIFHRNMMHRPRIC